MPTQAPKLNPYLRTKVLTASREELRLMLFDGALRFARQGRTAIEAHQHEAAYENMVKAQRIVLELSSSLNHEVMPDVCDKLSALYTYIYKLLVEATMQRKPELIDEAVKLLEYERSTWVMLMSNLDGETAGAPTEAGPRADNPYLQSNTPGEGLGGYSRSA